MAIPASMLVTVTPRLINAGGTDLVMNGLLLTTNPLIPLSNMALIFTSADDVGTYFGMTSDEYEFASHYFLGYDNSFKKPRSLVVAPRVLTSAPGWLRGGENAATLAQLQAVTNGSMTITIDGTTQTLTDVDLSSVTSFSDAAAALTTALGTAATVTYSSFTGAFQINSNTVGASSSVSYATGGESGTDLSVLLNLTEAAGAILSPGVEAMSVAENMSAIRTVTDNWVTFTTVYQATNDETLALAAWATAQGIDYLYVPWDDGAGLLDITTSTSIADQLTAASAAATAGVYDSNPDTAAFVAGAIASIDWNRNQGTITLAHKHQSGLAARVTDAATATALESKTWNFYGNYATRNDQFLRFFPGCMFGDYKFIDPYINAIWLKNALQVSIMSGLGNVGRVPYNDAGYTIIRAWVQDPVNRARLNGIIDVGLSLSESQKAQVINEVGFDISKELYTNGYYIQIDDPGASVRVNRESPTISLYYTYGGSVHRIDLASTAIL